MPDQKQGNPQTIEGQAPPYAISAVAQRQNRHRLRCNGYLYLDRTAALKDFVFEFKYLKPDELKLSGEALRKHTREQLHELPQVRQALHEASRQLAHYQQVLMEKYQQPQRLCCLAVIALGFERLLWQRL